MPERPSPKVVPHPFRSPVAGEPRYAELAVTSNFTFLTGASHPEELVRQAADLGHAGAAIADTNTLAGIVRAHVAAKEVGIPLAVGARVVVRRDEETERRRDEAPRDGVPRDEETERRRDGVCADLGVHGNSPTPSLRLSVSPSLSILTFPTTRAAYANLCRLLTLGKRRAPKGECDLSLHDLIDHAEGLLAVVMPPRVLDEPFVETLRGLRPVFADRLSLAVCRDYGPADAERLRQLADLSLFTGVELAAVNDVRYHVPERRMLQDVVTCIRCGCTIEEAGFRLAPNAERHLKPPHEMARLFAEFPRALARSADIAGAAAAFSLDEIRYEYPSETCPPGMSATAYLADRTWAGGAKRYPQGIPPKVQDQIRYELALIEELRYEAYFLTCHDIVEFARSQGIFCQGRGGAANSAVCYCLGITEVDPAVFSLLFERFVSRERGEPPDIDIDFEHERREEVIQYLYAKYGRDRAALTAEVISYRGRSAVREVGKAMGLSLDCVDVLAKNLNGWGESATPQRVREIGLDPGDPTIQRVIELTGQLRGFPRHLSQHVGGFVITQSPLHDLVPIENAAMEDRTVIEWDKDDIDAMGMLKVDCLGLGMLTCVGKALGMVVRDEETERRRDEVEGSECRANGNTRKENENGECEDVPRSGGVAAGDGAGQAGVQGDGEHARVGDLRADQPDASGGRVDPLEHRRGLREGDPSGSDPLSAPVAGLALRVGHPDRAGDLSGDALALGGAHRAGPGVRSGAPRPHPKPESQATLTTQNDPTNQVDPNHTTTSSLRLSVSSSLYNRYTALARDLRNPAVYDMICHADTIGVFQIESRAQMSMLPRLRPRTFYDLVIEVAIVRPGPIQGNMVHPYLRRRDGLEPVTFPNAAIEEVLGRTLGVPLFQEQAMRLAIVAAGFSPDEADKLRRAMAAWKRKGDAIFRFGEKLIDGMLARGYPQEFAERCFEQIKGFSEYGFPESHAASFAIVVYVSAWLKRYHPAAFAAALVNSQPMGFYRPAQIIRDAQEHGVEVRPVDVNRSEWDCTLERDEETERRRDEVRRAPSASERDQDASPGTWGRTGPAIRLGMRLVKGLTQADADRIRGAVRERGPFSTVESLWRASGVGAGAFKKLAQADAFGSMGLDRQAALWQIRPLRDDRLPLFDQLDGTDESGMGSLPRVKPGRLVLQDYDATGLSLKAHPVSFIRRPLEKLGVIPTADLRAECESPQGRLVRVAGVVLVRQRPATASGVVFITLEDETGIANLILWPKTFERFRRAARLSHVLLATGRVERQGEVVHVHVQRLDSLDDDIPMERRASRDFH